MTQGSTNKQHEQETMILRTVYLPPELDEELKKLAFHRSTSKGDLIRRAIRNLVEKLEAEEASPAAVASAVPDANPAP